MGYQDSGNRSCAFHSGNLNGDNNGNNKTIQKKWNEISKMFLIGSLSGIAVLGDVIRGYLPVNLILLFVFVNLGIMLFSMYLRKEGDNELPECGRH